MLQLREQRNSFRFSSILVSSVVMIMVKAGQGVLDEPYSARPGYICMYSNRMDTVPAYVDWRACTATPLSGLS
jgi:hypothetical protein